MKKELLNYKPSKEELIELFNSGIGIKETKTSLTIDLSKLKEEKAKEAPDVHIYFTLEAYVKQRALVLRHSKEIAWHGLVERHENNFIIYDILVYPQKYSSAYVEADEEEYVKWNMELEDETVNDMRMQGHSHVNMATTPSGQDESYYENLLQHVNDYYIIMVENKNESRTVRLYDKKNNIIYSNLEVDVLLGDNETTLNEWYQEVQENIQPIKVQTSLSRNLDYDYGCDYNDFYQSSFLGTPSTNKKKEESWAVVLKDPCSNYIVLDKDKLSFQKAVPIKGKIIGMKFTSQNYVLANIQEVIMKFTNTLDKDVIANVVEYKTTSKKAKEKFSCIYSVSTSYLDDFKAALVGKRNLKKPFNEIEVKDSKYTYSFSEVLY